MYTVHTIVREPWCIHDAMYREFSFAKYDITITFLRICIMLCIGRFVHATIAVKISKSQVFLLLDPFVINNEVVTVYGCVELSWRQ